MTICLSVVVQKVDVHTYVCMCHTHVSVRMCSECMYVYSSWAGHGSCVYYRAQVEGLAAQ